MKRLLRYIHSFVRKQVSRAFIPHRGRLTSRLGGIAFSILSWLGGFESNLTIEKRHYSPSPEPLEWTDHKSTSKRSFPLSRCKRSAAVHSEILTNKSTFNDELGRISQRYPFNAIKGIIKLYRALRNQS